MSDERKPKLHRVLVTIVLPADLDHPTVQGRVLVAAAREFAERSGPIEVRASREAGLERKLDAMTEERNSMHAELSRLEREGRYRFGEIAG